MFNIINQDAGIELLSTTKIFDNVKIEDFLNRDAIPSEIILCPVNAIDIDAKEILQNRCISCGICWLKAPDYIQFDGIYNKNVFIDYCKKDKQFVYRWLSLILSEYCGTNIKSRGFSRVKRIPLLIVLDDKTSYIVKASRTSKDIEKVYYELEDIIDLSKEELKSFKVQKIIVVIDLYEEDKDFFANFSDVIFLSLDKIIDNFLTKKYMNIKEHIDYSRC